jgi:hypothetical protein
MASSKNIQFYTGIGFLGSLFVFLLGYAGLVVYPAYSDASKVLLKVDSSMATLKAGAKFDSAKPAISLTDENVTAAQSDLTALKAQQDALRAAIAGEPENQIDSKFAGIANELGTQISESVSRWRREAAAKDVRLPRDEICFGFRRYIRNPGTQPPRLLKEVDRQRQIIGWLFTALVESRSTGTPLLLQSIDREPIETYPGASSVSGDGQGQGFSVDTPDAATLASKPQPDEFILSGHSFRRPGLVGSFAFRVRFAGKTDTLRVFLNTVQSSRKPFVVSAVEISVPSQEVMREINEGSARPLGGSPAATPGFGGPSASVNFGAIAPGGTVNSTTEATDKRAERVVVVKDAVSEYTVHLEYIFPVAAPANAGGPASK